MHWRRGRRIAAGVLLGLLAAVAGLLYYAHTPSGLERARARLQDQLRRTVPGLRIGRLVRWSLDGEVELADLSVHEPDGKPAIHIDSVLLQVQPTSVWSDTIKIDQLRIVAPRVQVRRGPDGRLNLAGLLRPGGRGQGSPGLVVSALQIADGTVEVATTQGTVAATRVAVGSGSLRVEALRPDLELHALSATVRRGDATLVLEGDAHLSAERAKVTLLRAQLDGIAPGAPIVVRGDASGPYHRIEVVLDADLPGGATGRFQGWISRDGSYDVRARGHGIDPRTLGAPWPGRLEATAAAHGRGLPLAPGAHAEGTVELAGSSLGDLALEQALLEGSLDGSRWQLARASLRATGLDLRAHGQGRGRALALEVDGTIDHRSALAHRLRGLRGAAQVRAHIGGRLPAPLEIRGHLRSSDLALAALHAGSTEARFDVTGWPRAARGSVHVEAVGLRAGSQPAPIGGLVLDLSAPGDRSFRLHATGSGAHLGAVLDASGRLERHEIRATLERLTVDRGGPVIELRAPATVRFTPGRALALEDARFHLLGGEALVRARWRADASGSPRAEADLTAQGVALLGMPVPEAALHAQLHQSSLELRLDATVGRSGTPLHAQASLPIAAGGPDPLPALAAHGPVALHVHAQGVRTDDLPEAMRAGGRLHEGTLDLDLEAGGDLAQPTGHAELKLHQARFATLAGLDAALMLDAAQGATRLHGRLLLAGAPFASLNGQARLDVADLGRERGLRWSEVPLDLVLDVPRFDLARLSDRVGPVRGVVSGHGSIAGTLGHPVGRAHFALEAAGLFSLRFGRAVADSVLDGRVLRTDLRAEQTGGGRLDARLVLDPAAQPSASAEIHARRLDIGVLRDFVPQLREVAGELDADLSLGGVLDQRPQVSGTVTLAHGRVRPLGLRPLQDVGLVLTLRPGRWEVNHVQARSGGGLLRGQGWAELAGLRPQRIGLTATAARFLVGYGGIASGHLDGDLTIDATTAPDALSTHIRIEHGAIALPELAKGRQLHAVGPLGDVHFVDRAAARARAEARPLRIDLALTVPDKLHVSGKDIDADVQGSFALADDGAGGRSATGMVEIQRGHVRVFGQRFEIERARLRWDGVPPGSATLDVHVNRQLPDALLTVVLHGTLDQPELSLSSDPPLYDQNQLAAMVLSGQPAPASSSGSASVSAAGTISSAVLGQVIAQIAPALPIDVVRIDVAQDTTPAGAAASAGTTEHYEFGKHFGDRIYISYVRVSGVQQNQSSNEAHFEFRLQRRWVLESAIGDAGEGGVDLFWTFRY